MDQDAPQREWGEDGLPIGETEGERVVREAREAEAIAQGYADAAAGRVIEWHVLMAYFDALDRGEAPPFPAFEGAPLRL